MSQHIRHYSLQIAHFRQASSHTNRLIHILLMGLYTALAVNWITKIYVPGHSCDASRSEVSYALLYLIYPVVRPSMTLLSESYNLSIHHFCQTIWINILEHYRLNKQVAAWFNRHGSIENEQHWHHTGSRWISRLTKRGRGAKRAASVLRRGQVSKLALSLLSRNPVKRRSVIGRESPETILADDDTEPT